MSATFRLATIEDASQIQVIYAPIVKDTFISFEEVVPDISEIGERIQKTLTQYPYLICEIDGQVAGYAYASAFRPRAAYQWVTETTIYVHPDFHRQGIARGLYTTLLNVLCEQGYLNVIGVIALPNDASVNLHENLGFKKIGVFENMGYKINGWRDTGWWQLELNPMPSNPQPPQPIANISHTKIFKELLIQGQATIKA